MKEIGKHWFTNRVINEWNILTIYVVGANTIKSFKWRLRQIDEWGGKVVLELFVFLELPSVDCLASCSLFISLCITVPAWTMVPEWGWSVSWDTYMLINTYTYTFTLKVYIPIHIHYKEIPTQVVCIPLYVHMKTYIPTTNIRVCT